MAESLATQLIIATTMAALTVVMHLLGLSALIAATNRHSNRLQTERALARQILVLLGVSFGLFILHGVEIWSYALVSFWVYTLSGVVGRRARGTSSSEASRSGLSL
jgi:prepilin signal peptidase PulO-like enzyme (type II secretory pathway)